MSSNQKLIVEKVEQAVGILHEKDIDIWLTFVRETEQVHDPCLDMILSTELQLTWHSAFILTKKGERIAIVGRFDKENVALTGAYKEVIAYDKSIRQPLVNVLKRINPGCIAINYSESDPAADGLTHGMWTQLFRLLEGTPYAATFISAEDVIAALRGRKSRAEVERVKNSIQATSQIFDAVNGFLKPGQREIDIRDYIHDQLMNHGLETAWEMDFCPIVNGHPDTPIGHAAATERRTAPGHTLQIDFGVKKDDFCSDVQRMWYFLDKGETKPPPDVQKGFDAVRAAIESAAKVLKPGALGWEVDQAARSTLTKLGYPEYQHATGHELGRSAHDGATVLGPRWERYGESINGEVEVGNIFTLELGVHLPTRGYISLEEDVLVTPNGLEWLTKPQTQLMCI
ncbi:MAG TPA: Xaa-Pro peptidase family protein [Anaerolineae bacterium]|nr:Xaa-Pro peptidase family protein [Anaerolineae bacterium]